jgi:hypothetical protein
MSGGFFDCAILHQNWTAYHYSLTEFTPSVKFDAIYSISVLACHESSGKKGRPRSDKRGVDLISDTLLFGRLWYAEPEQSTMQAYAKFFSRYHPAVIHFSMKLAAKTHQHTGDLKDGESSTESVKEYFEIRTPEGVIQDLADAVRAEILGKLFESLPKKQQYQWLTVIL